MTATQWGARLVGGAIFIVLPWMFAAWFYPVDSVTWECHLAFEVFKVTPDQAEERSVGIYSQFFRADLRGFSRLSGRKEQLQAGDKTRVSNFHRVVDFEYAQAGPYLKKKIIKVARKKGDTLAQDQDLPFMTPVGEDTYSQVFRLGANSYAFGRLGMPRQICQDRQGWLTPRLR